MSDNSNAKDGFFLSEFPPLYAIRFKWVNQCIESMANFIINCMCPFLSHLMSSIIMLKIDANRMQFACNALSLDANR